MLSPNRYKNSHAYNFFIRMLGYESSIERFLRSLDVDCRDDCHILDAGCGTGLLGLHFLQRFPKSSLVATDLEPNFLHTTSANARRRDIALDRITLGIANITDPKHVTNLNGESWDLEEASFDLICVGAVLGYAEDTAESVRQLLRLLAPGGQLINLEMNEGVVGRFVSSRYHYDNIRLARIRSVIEQSGCEVKTRTLRLSHLPARLTRTAILARKTDLNRRDA